MFDGRFDRHRREYDAGEVIFEENDWGKYLLVVDEGKINIEKSAEDGTQTITTVGSGSIVGEMVFASGDYRRTATARADSPTTGWKLQEDHVRTLMGKNETFRQKLFTVLTRRLENTTERLTELLELKDRQIRLSLLLSSFLDEDDVTAEEYFSKSLQLTPELLAYRFRTTYDRMQSLFDEHTGESLAEMDEENRPAYRRFADRCLRELLENLNLRVPDSLTEESDVRASVVEHLRDLEDSLEDIDDPEETLSRGDFSRLKKTYSEALEVLEEYRDLESSTYLADKLETALGSVQQHLRKFDPSDFEE